MKIGDTPKTRAERDTRNREQKQTITKKLRGRYTPIDKKERRDLESVLIWKRDKASKPDIKRHAMMSGDVTSG